MLQKDFDNFFGKISKDLPVSLIAKHRKIESSENFLKVEDSLPVFDALELLRENDYLLLEDGRIVQKHFLLKRPLRIAFFVLLSEIESRLYRIQEWNGLPLHELNDKTMNDFIRLLLSDSDLFSFQKQYSSRSEFKEDLKAISSVRNLVVHVNKRMEMETDFETIVKRKNQLSKLLNALSEILGKMAEGRK